MFVLLTRIVVSWISQCDCDKIQEKWYNNNGINQRRKKGGVEEDLTFAYDSVETENKNKDVLKCQLVTTS